ncbi:hypothetical protein GW17_00021010 [Ensete ventricosum]|uniref:Uncharacterized protein n=1 Tax=Ensete ventricosum TaxID=4639 RepID=A0A444EXT3_ENSVE|nr:hypothetical protein B296_00033271 [Ensete ventricosum]RWW15171.1 hypothetical protein GW17_00021010 [Ensete ventricosum]
MAGRLSGVASRIMGGNGVAARSAASALRSRSGMGMPVGKHIVPDKAVKFRLRSFFTKRWHGCAEGSASLHRSVCLLSGTTKRPRYPL